MAGLERALPATWGGFVFLHLTPAGAAPLADQLGPVPERLRRYPLDALRVGRRLAYHVAANWKLVAENYDLVLGPLPDHRRVLVTLGAAHGFKFAPLLGRVLADLTLHDGTDVDLTAFAVDRAALAAPAPQANYLV